MQHSQFNVAKAVLIGLAAAGLFLTPARAGRMVHDSRPDPLLNGGDSTPCTQSPEYLAGQDATGKAVVPADVGAGPVPVPEAVMVPVPGRHRAAGPGGVPGAPYVALDGRKLDPLLNPPPCR